MPNHLRGLLTEAVEKYNKPGTGVLLSGGIDSATIAALAPALPAFTGYYKGAAYDEREWAYASVFESGKDAPRDWHEIEITPQDWVENIDACLASLEAPYAGPGTFGQYMVAKYVSQHVDTVLSGEGGDELFGGYARLHLVAGVEPPDGYENYQLPPDYPDTLDEALVWEFNVNLPALLRVDAQVTAAHGLRAVAPMVESPELIAYVLSQSDYDRVGKTLLKRAVRGLVPDVIIDRTDKRGFAVPYVEWANGPLRDWFMDRIGYIPEKSKPWDRKYWYDLCAGQTALA